MDPLHDHGDRQVPPGAVDLAVNVWGPAPDWLLRDLREVDLAAYPDPAPAVEALAARHGVATDECLLLNGAAEAFWLLAQALRPRLAVCVHPSFTAPEAALRSCGVPVHRVLRDAAEGFALDPAAVPEEADLVVLGRPDNPTGRHESEGVLTALARPGRVLVVDEAFADFLPDAASAYAARIPGLVCVRSLTKLWGLAGLRVGYLLAASELTRRLRAERQPWPVSSLAVRAATLLAGAEEERRERADAVARARASLLDDLSSLPLTVWPSPANFLLLRDDDDGLRERLLEHGIAARRTTTFPGLDGRHARVAVHPDTAVRTRLVSALRAVLPEGGSDAATFVPVAAPVHRTLVLGGARSGKSRHAQRLLAHLPDVVYVAPGPVPDGTDDDWTARVAAHRRNRPAGWTTRETTDVAGVLDAAERPVLVDCLATWLAAAMDAAGAWDSTDGDTEWEQRLDAEVERLVAAWRSATVPVVAVSNEVGSGVVPSTRAGVLFRDALGRLNQRLAADCDDVRLVVAGRVQRLTGDRV
ncbi:MAG TPA: bifunctional adenosylcobinamide kinase/adenosylcobinamide-phosphate guanylyltransferase [Nocardioides sp.]|nr:bifunctional adenosylcobinamide kinase/adenosylcobinamide-phosphate guanylyltransferase [Nocardioides sp.]